jgi:Mg-chelatase subunit ChlD
MTNIGDGIRSAREHLQAEGRTGAYKMIVLITDGKANLPSETDPEQYARYQAQLTDDAGIPILTISLGADADQVLMGDIAEETNGIHFNVPGGQTVAEYEEDLKDVFELIAKDRPLKLVL